VTHVVGAALARALMAVPEVQSRIVFGRIKPFESCDIGFAVDVQDGADLAPVKVRGVDQLTPLEVARKLTPKVASVRAGTDPAHSRSSSIVRHLPWWSLRPVLNTASLLVGGLGIPAFGQPASPLGAFMVPLPLARTPIYLAIGAVRDVPFAAEGSVVIRPQLVLVATGDHRIVDGAQAGRIVTVLRELLADPARLDLPWQPTGT
jgi:pyruvate dehydrogenase E2 component (dihydrolipoamide acetyltransferase)